MFLPAPLAATPVLTRPMLRSRTFQSALAILLLCAVGVPAWRWVARPPELRPAPELELGAVPVGLQTVAPRVLTVRASAYGTLRARAEVTLAAEVGGRLKWVWEGWRLGAPVAAGQELVRIDRSRIELELARAEARLAEIGELERAAAVEQRAAERMLTGVREQLELARREERRWLAARTSESVAAGDVDRSRRGRVAAELSVSEAQSGLERAQASERSARAQRATLEADLALIRDRLERCTVRAPLAGRLGELPPVVGRLVAPGEVLGVLADESSFLLRVDVSEAELAGIAPGNPARIELVGAGGSAADLRDGRVIGRATRADPLTRSVGVEIEVLPEADRAPLVAGLFAHAVIDVSELPAALWIERGHFRWESGVPVAYVRLEGHAERRELMLGAEVGEGFVVASGLAAGEELITEPLDRLWDGREVEPR